MVAEMLTQMPGYAIHILSIDTAVDPSLNIHDDALWRFLLETARAGRILGLLLHVRPGQRHNIILTLPKMVISCGDHAHSGRQKIFGD